MSQSPGEMFLLEEYRALQEAYLRNEELGERRVSLLLGLVGAVLAALTAGFLGEDRRTASAAGMVGFAALLLLGASTLARVIRRNLITTKYLKAAAQIRAYFHDKSPEIHPHMSFPIGAGKIDARERKWTELGSFRSGGLAENVEIVNSLVAAGLGAAVALYFIDHPAAVATTSVASLVAALVLQFAWVKRSYKKGL